MYDKKEKLKLINIGQQNLKKIEKDKFISKESQSIKAALNDENLTKRYSSSKKKLRDMNVVESEFTNEENPKKDKESNKKSSPFKKLQRFDSGPIENEEVEKSQSIKAALNNENLTKRYSSSKKKLRDIKVVESEFTNEENQKKNKESNKKSSPFKELQRLDSGPIEKEEVEKKDKNNKSNQINNIKRMESGSEEEEEIPKEKNEEKKNKSNQIKKIEQIESGSEQEEEIPKEENVNKNTKLNKIKNIEQKKLGSEQEEDEEYEKVMNDITKAPSQWSLDEMIVNLSKFHLNYYRSKFKLKQIDGKKFLKIENFEEIDENYDNSDIDKLLKCQLNLQKLEKKFKSRSQNFKDFEMPSLSNKDQNNFNNDNIEEKKRPEKKEDGEENKELLTRKKKKIIPLVLIKKDKEEKEYKIDKNCKIGSLLGSEIRIIDDDISRNHAEINLIDYNFYIKDSGSTNGTFIKLMENSNLRISEGMCFDVGSHFLKILTLDNNKRSIVVSFSNDIDFDNSENFPSFFGSKTEIIFGKKPPKSKSNIEFTLNNNLAEQHGLFILNDHEEFELRPLKSENGIWLKLEILDKSKSPFCRLIPNMQIKFSDSHIFIVKECNFSDLKQCRKCDKIRNSVYLNCLHSIYCLSCAKDKFKKKNKCLECKKDIESIREIINIPNK